MANKKRGLVLVTGAAGFTGHHMVMEAVKAGFKVRATDLSSRHYGAMFEALDVEFVKSDITNRQDLDSLLAGVDGIIHVAGIHDYSTPDKLMWAVNVNAVENLCDAATRVGIQRFVHFSSVNVYGFNSNPGNPVKEDDPKQTPPHNNYNTTKWEGEKVVWKYIKEKGLRATIMRPAAIYGTRAEYGLYYVFKMQYKERKKKKSLMVGKGTQTEAFLHVEDMCRAVIHAFDTDAMIGEAYNVSDDTRMSTADFFRLVSSELIGKEKKFFHIPLSVVKPVAVVSQLFARIMGTKSILEKATLEYMAANRIWDNSKLKSTGFEFKYPTMQKGMRETLKWYKDHGWLNF